MLADMDASEKAFCWLALISETDVRATIKQYVYAEYPYGSKAFQNMARKAWEAHLLIEKAVTEHKNPVVMCSWGKDSLVVLHMVLMHNQSIKVLWNDTLVEFTSTYKLAKRLISEWKLNMVVTRPTTTFWKIQAAHGWPTKGRGVNDEASEVCCHALKKEPTARAQKIYKWDLSFLGLNATESRNRGLSAKKYGDYFYAKSWGMWRCYPILNWSQEEIWDYIVFNQLPVNDVYRPVPVLPGKTEEELLMKYREYPFEPDSFHWNDLGVVNSFIKGYIPRTGCWPCAIGLKFGKLGYYRRFFPRYYDILVKKKGLGLFILNQKYNSEGGSMFPPSIQEVEDTLAMRPCAFDKV